MSRPKKEPSAFFTDTSGIFPDDDFNNDEASYMDEASERELMGWLKPDEQVMWAASKATRRRAIPVLLRRIAKMRQGG